MVKDILVDFSGSFGVGIVFYSSFELSEKMGLGFCIFLWISYFMWVVFFEGVKFWVR